MAIDTSWKHLVGRLIEAAAPNRDSNTEIAQLRDPLSTSTTVARLAATVTRSRLDHFKH
jgi:hypothetical protein